MIKLMIADDEAGIRRGLRQYVDWNAWGIQLVAEAENGAEAYRLALDTRPDILLSDIRMPQKSGLELVRELKAPLPGLQVILLTGYNDTDYLQEALRAGVKDYLLKPAGADKIIEAVLRVRDELLQDLASRQEHEQKNTLLNEGLPILQMHFMNDLLHGRIPTEEAALRKARMLRLPLDTPYCQIALLRQGISAAADYCSDQESAMDFWQLTQLISLTLERCPGSFFTEWEPETLLLVAGGEHEEDTRRVLSTLCSELVDTISPQQYPSLAVGLGCPVSSLLNLPRSYRRALRALELSAWDRSTRLFSLSSSEEPPAGTDLKGWEVRLMNACLARDWRNTHTLLEEFFSDCVKHHADFSAVKALCSRLLSHLSSGSSGSKAAEVRAVDTARIASCLYADELQSWLLFRLPSPEEPNQTNPNRSALVLKAEQYVRYHYAENLTLQKISTEIFVSPNYLGRLFREQTGYKFVDWLNLFRVEQAKRLLEQTEARTSEVATQSGFTSYKYFSVCFLKYVGCSAREYRARRKPLPGAPSVNL